MLILALKDNRHCHVETTHVIFVAQNKNINIPKAVMLINNVLFSVTDNYFVADIRDFEVIVDSLHMEMQLRVLL